MRPSRHFLIALALVVIAVVAVLYGISWPGEEGWGPAVSGLQCRAWVDNAVVPLGSDLVVNYELRNAGGTPFGAPSFGHHDVHLEWLDRQDSCSCTNEEADQGERIEPAAFVITLKPGGTWQGDERWWSIRSGFPEARRENARLRVTYFTFPLVSEGHSNAWVPAPNERRPWRVSSREVVVRLEPRLPGDAYSFECCCSSGCSLDDAWLMADLVVRARVRSTVSPKELVEPGYHDRDEPRRMLLREGIRLTVSEALGGQTPAGELSADCITDPAFERPLVAGEEIVAFLMRFGEGSQARWRLFKAVRPTDVGADVLNRLLSLHPSEWGNAEKGLKCRLLGPAEPVSAAQPVEFAVVLRFDAASADQDTEFLNRVGEPYRTIALEFTNPLTGKTYVRHQQEEPGGLPLSEGHQHRRTLRSDPLPPARVKVRLVDTDGATVPPGEYEVAVAYCRKKGSAESYPTPGWLQHAWVGTIRSPKVPVRVVETKPEAKAFLVPTALDLHRSPEGIMLNYRDENRKTVMLKQQPGFNVYWRSKTAVYLNDKQDPLDRGYNRFSSAPPARGRRGDVFGDLNLKPVSRESLRFAVRVSAHESPSYVDKAPWGEPNEHPALWEDTIEGTLAPACEPDAPRGDWGGAVDGLQARLVLSRKRIAPDDPLHVFLDVRNNSDKPMKVPRSRMFPQYLRIHGPDGEPVKPIEAVWSRDDERVYLDALAAGEEGTPLTLRTTEHFRLTKPGHYRVEWLGAGPPEVGQGTPIPPAPAVTFDVVAGE